MKDFAKTVNFLKSRVESASMFTLIKNSDTILLKVKKEVSVSVIDSVMQLYRWEGGEMLCKIFLFLCIFFYATPSFCQDKILPPDIEKWLIQQHIKDPTPVMRMPTMPNSLGIVGTAKWAFGRAQSTLRMLGINTRLMAIAGARVFRDGRLPANEGEWIFLASRKIQNRTFMIRVDYTGKVRQTVYVGLPKVTSELENMRSWADSPAVFSKLPSICLAFSHYADTVTLNLNAPLESMPKEIFWAIQLAQMTDKQYVSQDANHLRTNLGPQLRSAFFNSNDEGQRIAICGGTYVLNRLDISYSWQRNKQRSIYL